MSDYLSVDDREAVEYYQLTVHDEEFADWEDAELDYYYDGNEEE